MIAISCHEVQEETLAQERDARATPTVALLGQPHLNAAFFVISVVTFWLHEQQRKCSLLSVLHTFIQEFLWQ